MNAVDGSASPSALLNLAMSRFTASLSLSSTGPTQNENPRCAVCGFANSFIASSGNGATSSDWNSDVPPPKPEKRVLMYVLNPGLLISPSLITSRPTSRCLATRSTTASSILASSAASSTSSPSIRAHTMSASSSGRGRLPACVVRIRSAISLHLSDQEYAPLLQQLAGYVPAE